jgi:hypothetical protein
VSALALDKLLGNLHHGRIRFGIRQSIKDRSCVVDVALLVEGLSDQTALGRAQGDGAFSLAITTRDRATRPVSSIAQPDFRNS